MAAALQIWSSTFSRAFDALPRQVQTDVQCKVDEMGARLEVSLVLRRPSETFRGFV